MAAPTGVASQYAAQVTTDLEHNTKEQERISGDIAALQEKLAALQHDHSVLLSVQQALGGTAGAAPRQPVTARDNDTVPGPREDDSAASGAAASKPARAKKSQDSTRPSAKKQASRKAAAQKPSGKAAGAKGTQTTLVELVRRHLAKQPEPRTAAEVTEALTQAHPERGIKSTVVRTTLENLVSRSQARRSKQGSSVRYVASEVSQEASAAGQDEAQSLHVE